MAGSLDRGANRAPEGSRALQPEEFAFYGFGDLTRDELRKILRLGIRQEDPTVETVDGAIFVPATSESGAGQPKFAGGVVRPDGSPIESAQMHRKGGKRFGGVMEPLALAPEAVLDEDVVYLGPLFNHYGRVLLESLARVWYLKSVDPSVRVVFTSVNAAQAAHAPWISPILDAFGVPAERLLHLDRPTRLRRAIVPEPLFEQFHSAHGEMVRPFRAVAERLAGDQEMSDQPLYLSRQRLSSRQRPVIGESQLEELLRQNGFLIAYPETMPFEDQVRLVNRHRDIVSTIGSAAHNVLFSTRQPQLHLLANRDDVPANYFLCSALAETPTSFVNCLGSGGRTTPNDERLSRREGTRDGGARRVSDPDAGPQSLPQLLDLEAITTYLRQQGFLARPLAASGSTRAEELQREFAEAWVFARVRKSTGKTDVLPSELEAEAVQVATRSWPVSLMLARFFARARDTARTDELVEQFVALLSAESDESRLSYYRGDVEGLTPRVARVCSPAVADRLAAVLASRMGTGQASASGEPRQ